MYIIVIVTLKPPVLAVVRHRQSNLDNTNPVRLHPGSPGKDEKQLHLAPRNNSPWRDMHISSPDEPGASEGQFFRRIALPL
jgi:hypothetical protein